MRNYHSDRLPLILFQYFLFVVIFGIFLDFCPLTLILKFQKVFFPGPNLTSDPINEKVLKDESFGVKIAKIQAVLKK